MLTAVYDLWSSPPTFDFTAFMAAAHNFARSKGHEKIRYVILPGPKDGFRNDSLPPYSAADRCKMLNNIVVPMARLGTLTDSVTVYDHRHEFVPSGPIFPGGWTAFNRASHYGFDKLVANLGEQIITAVADEDYRDYITITLRQSSYHSTRNSNDLAWHKVGHYLTKRGHNVRFLPEGLVDNAGARCAIYAAAKINIGVNNGPMWMMPLLKAPGMIFKMTSDNAPCVNEPFFQACGFPVGSQMETVQIVWADDTYENIIAALEARGL